MSSPPAPKQRNTLGAVSLVLGVLGSTFVVMVGLCTGLGHEQGWLPAVGGILFIMGGTAAFLGVLATLLGFGGLFGRNRTRATAIIGFLLGLFTIWLFGMILNATN
ncbi:MAG: hypothetical protein NXI22_21735 [bacterium]|nr:hypothetical protein [bacterium]